MQLYILHHTQYQYSEPVYLEPHILRMRPKSDCNQTVHDYQCQVLPRPDGWSDCIALDGGAYDTVWFSGQHRTLEIEIRSHVTTHGGEPFNFLITHPQALTLPLQYTSDLAEATAPYLQCNSQNAAVVAELTQAVMRQANYDTLSFITDLAQLIPSRLTYMLREHGDPWRAEQTLEYGKGSCRDFAVLFIEICRQAGIASRFVSGYCLGETASDHHMHAWAEVYLPGAGWRGFDPSRGVTVSDDHIVVATSPSPALATPISGSFRGDATATMQAQVEITVEESAS